MLGRSRKSVLVYMRPRQYRSWKKHSHFDFLIGLKDLGLCRQRTPLNGARRGRKVSEECTMYIRLRRYQSCRPMPATTLARCLLSSSSDRCLEGWQERLVMSKNWNHSCRIYSEEPLKIPVLSLDHILMFPSVSTMVNISLGSCLFFPSSLRYSTCCFKN